jgi:hypothetical protein
MCVEKVKLKKGSECMGITGKISARFSENDSYFFLIRILNSIITDSRELDTYTHQ